MAKNPYNTVNTGANPSSDNPVSGLKFQNYTPEQREVDRDTETAYGQINSILSNPDDPLIKRAQTLAMQGKNRSGLINSSMMQGEAVGAVMDRLTPIATHDATTYSNRALANMDAVNQSGQFNVGQNNQLYSQGLNIEAQKQMQREQAAAQAAMQQQNLAAQAAMQASQQNFAAMQNDLNFQNQQKLMDYQAQLTQYNGSLNFAANAANNVQQSISNILLDPNMNQAAKDAAIDNVIAAGNAQLKYGADIYGTPLTSLSTPVYGQTGTFQPGSSTASPPGAPTFNTSGVQYNPNIQLPSTVAPPIESWYQSNLEYNPNIQMPSTESRYQSNLEYNPNIQLPSTVAPTIESWYQSNLGYMPNSEGLRYWTQVQQQGNLSDAQLRAAMTTAATQSGELRR